MTLNRRHLLAAGLGRRAVDEGGEVLLDVRGDAGDVLRADDVDRGEGDGKVEGGEDEVHAERVPAVRLDEVLESL